MVLGMVVLVPLGLRLLDTQERRLHVLLQCWLLPAIAAAGSLLLEPGPFAVVLALPYLIVAGWLAVLGVWRPVRRRALMPVDVAVLTAMVSPVVAAVSLLAERGGVDLLGFGPSTLALTVAHSHIAGFVASVMAALAAATTGSAVADVAALAVPAGVVLVFVGFITVAEVELLGAVVLATGTWLLAGVLGFRIRRAAPSRLTRVLFAVSAVSVAVSMVLAVSWAAARVWPGFPNLSLSWMVATHGWANTAGFALCGLLGWWRVRRELAG